MDRLFLPTEGVDASLRGFARAHAGLVELHEDPTYLLARERHPDRRVGIVSGGGSGHEPMHAGFLGRGLLDAAVPGRVFASPHNRQVYEAGKAVAGPDGVLLVVKNYTGDRINFGIAAERLRADGVEVRRVLVDDDVATESEETGTGRRGTGATPVVEKLLGAAADSGLGLDELAHLGERVVAASRSLAVASRAQTRPADGGPAFELPDGELEYGVGIHGERAQRTVSYEGLEHLVPRMVSDVLDSLERAEATGDDVLLLTNGMGATTLLELYTVHDAAAGALEERGLRVAAQAVGTLVPGLDMAGFSLTVTRLRDDWLDLWRAPAVTPAFPAPTDIPAGTPTGSPAPVEATR
ncbi:dihydroxyacetone kinase [Xylanimonas oleitrophica]|uniref:Dihydroxyacetone kinase n=1 Tax=Xylanimonas oleitrophica TaxID=2607479 RepID=A0A2W5WWI7_9MICO|nr:dihydroxyacetone kinase subunit DhaK [Xylanimonas oleitrophica]PZR55530.1 dihydroxyacetone kinase [Xylanimonas oleitrophica]